MQNAWRLEEGLWSLFSLVQIMCGVLKTSVVSSKVSIELHAGPSINQFCLKGNNEFQTNFQKGYFLVPILSEKWCI